MLLDLDATPLAQTADQLPGSPPLTLVADVTEEAAADDAFAQIVAVHKRIDVLVNKVSGLRNQKLWEMTADAWGFAIRLNLRSAFLCTRAAARVMMHQGSGAIVCKSSGAREGTPWTPRHDGGAAYSATQAGIHGFIRDAAMEHAEHGIRINAVAPDLIETERTAKMFGELRVTGDYNPHRLVPMRRIGQRARSPMPPCLPRGELYRHDAQCRRRAMIPRETRLSLRGCLGRMSSGCVDHG